MPGNMLNEITDPFPKLQIVDLGNRHLKPQVKLYKQSMYSASCLNKGTTESSI